MTITNDSCNSITITSPLLQPTNQSAKLKVTKPDGSEYSLDLNVNDTSITITDDIVSGIWQFTIQVATNTSDIAVVSKCYFTYCEDDFDCRLLEALTSNDLTTYLRLKAFSLVNQCETCRCPLLREIYNKLNNVCPCHKKCGCM